MGRAWRFGVLAEGTEGRKAGSGLTQELQLHGLVRRIKVLMKILWTFWEEVCQFLKKKKKIHLELLYDSIILTLGIYPKEWKTWVRTNPRR